MLLLAILSGPLLLKYMDKDGDMVTITCRGDVQLALAEALKATDRRLGVIPPIRVTATVVDKVRGSLFVTRGGGVGGSKAVSSSR
jgi:hypothetical protein